MFITSTKPAIPGQPFGFNDGRVALDAGEQRVAKYGFGYDGMIVPAGSILTLVERNPRFTRFELKFPESSTVM